MKRKILIGALALAGAVMTACAGGSGGYYARYGPPAPRYRVVGVAPGPGYVWTDGYWNLHNRRWTWVDGRWVRPPRHGATWVAPRWQQRGERWEFHRGYWR
jgi:hypothetical protein